MSNQSFSTEMRGLSFENVFNRRRISKGLGYFAVLSITGMTILSIYTSTPQTLEAFGRFQLHFLLIAVGLAALDLLLGGWRGHIFMRAIKPGISPFLALRANLANELMAALTPTQSGGGPAWMFILYRGGIPIPVSLSISIITFISTLLWFALMAGISWVIIKDRFSQHAVTYFVKYSFLALSVIMVFMLVALAQPKGLFKLIHALAKALSRKRANWSERITTLSARLVSGIEQFHATVKYFLQRRPLLLLYCFALTALLYSTKFTLAYFILRGLGVEADYWSVIAIQAVLRLMLYFAPTPGGSGIAELGIAVLMAALMESYLLPVFTILYRFFQVYLPGGVGALVLMSEFTSGKVNAAAMDEEEAMLQPE